MARLLVLMGSGETSPTMTKTHRQVLACLRDDVRRDLSCVLLDTPAGFQENVDIVSARALEYFAESCVQKVEVASVRGDAASAVRTGIVGRALSGAGPSAHDALARETALTRVRTADWVFAGPGSPTYALAQWKASVLPELLRTKLVSGGAVIFSSAAACTAGAFAVPVYEVYKCGFDPFWEDGLDLLGAATGIRAAVIPHFDNTEGGNHDTRFCYLGERRLRILEPELPDDAVVFGVDEHTAAVFDLDAGTMEVTGNGGVHIRTREWGASYPTGSVVATDSLLRAPLTGPDGPMDVAAGSANRSSADTPSGAVLKAGPAGSSTPSDSVESSEAGAPRDGLAVEVDVAEGAFEEGVARGDAPAATRALLGLDGALTTWGRDPTSTVARDGATTRGNALRRSMIVRLGELAVGGTRDPREVVGPFVEAMLALRVGARTDKRWADADAIRDALTAAGVELRDGQNTTEWLLVVR